MKDITENENIQKINVMLIGCNGSLKMPQDSSPVSPVQHSAMFIIYTNSRNLFGEEQTKFSILKSKVRKKCQGIQPIAKQTAILRHKGKT